MKTRIIVCGCFGRMGKTVCEMAAKEPDMEVAAGVDIIFAAGGLAFPVYGDIGQVTAPADAIIDFLPPTALADTLAVLEYSAREGLPLVLCTTGLPRDAEAAIARAAEKTAVLRSPNMSLGVNLLSNMLGRAARLLYDAHFDVEIIEKHHNQKLDSPSGTAIMLAEAVNAALGGHMRLVHGRSRGKAGREREEIGLHALRGGSIVGEHSVVFAGLDEVIEFTHIAQSRDAFAVGALKAARFIRGKPPGLYTMQDLINEI